jgi:hypothetical protein
MRVSRARGHVLVARSHVSARGYCPNLPGHDAVREDAARVDSTEMRPAWIDRVKGKWLPTTLVAFMSVATLAAFAVTLLALYVWYAASHGALDHLTK